MYREPLSVVGFANAEQCFQRVVAWDHESSNVGEELAPDIEEDQEEVGRDETEESVNFRDRGLLLQIV